MYVPMNYITLYSITKSMSKLMLLRPYDVPKDKFIKQSFNKNTAKSNLGGNKLAIILHTITDSFFCHVFVGVWLLHQCLLKTSAV